MSVLVPFLTGYGDGEIPVAVAYIADGFPRNEDGNCAFCNGDPLAEDSPADTVIAQFWRRHPNAGTCPMCQGRPS